MTAEQFIAVGVRDGFDPMPICRISDYLNSMQDRLPLPSRERKVLREIQERPAGGDRSQASCAQAMTVLNKNNDER